MEIRKLTEICNPKQWKTIPAKELTTIGYPVYGANGIIGYWPESNHKFDTITIGCRGTCGNINIAFGETYINGNAMCLDDLSPIVDIHYLYYYLQHYNFMKVISGTTIPQITRQGLEKVDVIIYPMEEQKELVSIFQLLDSVIIFRREQLTKLDELVKSRFVELFGEWKSDPEPLKSFLEDITYGFTNPMPDAAEGPWKVTAKDVVNGKVNYDTARKTTVDAFEALTAKSKPAVGDVLLTKDGTLGRCAVVEEGGICVNQSVAVLKCNNKILPKFLAILLQMPEYQGEMLKNAGGGTIKHIYITRVVDMLIMVPTISQQLEFLSFVEQTDKSKLAIQQSLEKLEALKKALMQKYFG